MLVTVHEFVSGGALAGYAFVGKSSYEHARDSAVVFKAPWAAGFGAAPDQYMFAGNVDEVRSTCTAFGRRVQTFFF